MKVLIEKLSQVSELWLDSGHPLRKETIQALQVCTSFSRRQIEIALTNCFGELTQSKITAFVEDWGQSPQTRTFEIGDSPQQAPKCVLHILPSNAFTAWVHGAVTTLLLGHRCVLKPSKREPVFARAWKRSLAEIDPGLTENVEVISWDEKWLQESQAVVAYGSDETLQDIQSRLPSGVRFAGYGHKLSVGIIFQEALEERSTEELLNRVRRDAEPFRLQGCLSPQILYVEDARFTRWPQLEAVVDVAPKVKPFTQWEEVLQELAKFRPYLSSVGYAGTSQRGDLLKDKLKDLGVSRICLLGDMQRPPLSWRNGGIFLPDLLN